MSIETPISCCESRPHGCMQRRNCAVECRLSRVQHSERAWSRKHTDVTCEWWTLLPDILGRGEACKERHGASPARECYGGEGGRSSPHASVQKKGEEEENTRTSECAGPESKKFGEKMQPVAGMYTAMTVHRRSRPGVKCQLLAGWETTRKREIKESDFGSGTARTCGACYPSWVRHHLGYAPGHGRLIVPPATLRRPQRRPRIAPTAPKTLHISSMRWPPEAKIVVSTPYYTGSVVTKCLEEPLSDLVIENLPGARQVDNPDPEWTMSQQGAQKEIMAA
ncbi:hypothetical protein HPB50_017840 [Hyalomma asiaticum]|uniref:Uncharacterized protein n=1 Tax=Hyalomma asiaticum TaxID=266040 RepID=A0ACB7TK23_HYAAI|nr:hypothetical protein HPB50_017840 [Hyalomma asiaticum]